MPKIEKWKYWILIMFMMLWLLIVTLLVYKSPEVMPPTHMKSSDPYWYSGE